MKVNFVVHWQKRYYIRTDGGESLNMNNRFVIIIAVIIVAFFGLLFFNKKGANTSNNSTGDITVTNHVYGQSSTGVVLTEYGDFECPACYRFYPIVQELKTKYKDQVSFQFRHYPLLEIHQHALLSAKAAEAAGMQGKFFEMHDLLYQNQPQWTGSTNPTPTFEGFASQLGLDTTKFQADMKSDKVNKTVLADRNEAKKQGYASTPTFVLDGKQLTDVRDDVAYFSKLIDDAIAAKKTNGQ
ncbi:MAG: hypothetical protein JWL85_10 [Candidatus Saccharibacteria bacterium]|nr:hypothetical protein [Candidatus Saccharibacteria bacterium]